MIEKDNIQELFSKAFENHASPVRPDLWAGVQAKMAAAAGATGGAVAAKGISVFAKWLIGTAAITTVGITTYVVTSTDTPTEKQANPIALVDQTTTEAPSVTNREIKSEVVASETKQVVSNKEAKKEQMHISEIGPKPGKAVRYTNNDLRYPTVQGEANEPISQTLSPVVTEPKSIVNPQKSVSQSPIVTETKKPEKATPIVPTDESAQQTQRNEAKVPAAKIELPNIFTPNGDRDNDLCKFVTIENVKSVEITIIGADGKTVYKSNEINFAWDGTIFGDEQARVGIYTCLISYIDLADQPKNKAAYIYLQR